MRVGAWASAMDFSWASGITKMHDLKILGHTRTVYAEVETSDTS